MVMPSAVSRAGAITVSHMGASPRYAAVPALYASVPARAANSARRDTKSGRQPSTNALSAALRVNDYSVSGSRALPEYRLEGEPASALTDAPPGDALLAFLLTALLATLRLLLVL